MLLGRLCHGDVCGWNPLHRCKPRYSLGVSERGLQLGACWMQRLWPTLHASLPSPPTRFSSTMTALGTSLTLPLTTTTTPPSTCSLPILLTRAGDRSPTFLTGERLCWLHTVAAWASFAMTWSRTSIRRYVEGAQLFKRAGVYYLAYGSCCCFCRGGSGLVVYQARNISGPWVRQQFDLNCNSTGEVPPFRVPSSPPQLALRS